ncbi:MAG TPA: hypothetical protein VJ994_01635 [Paracoccaceae bacterium]|nr:hypothetical protein [Paracoccaceae bacterium]
MADGAAPGARLTLERGVRLWRATLWPESWQETTAAIGWALGVTPPAPGASVAGAFGRLWRPEPLVWAMLDAPGDGPPRAFAGIGPETGAVAETGPGVARLAVRGAHAAELLARAVTLDLRPAAFPPGAVATTGWRDAAVTVIRPENGGLDLLTPLSFAEDFAAVLARHARQFG